MGLIWIPILKEKLKKTNCRIYWEYNIKWICNDANEILFICIDKKIYIYTEILTDENNICVC